jgi:hypothetical protein
MEDEDDRAARRKYAVEMKRLRREQEDKVAEKAVEAKAEKLVNGGWMTCRSSFALADHSLQFRNDRLLRQCDLGGKVQMGAGCRCTQGGEGDGRARG